MKSDMLKEILELESFMVGKPEVNSVHIKFRQEIQLLLREEGEKQYLISIEKSLQDALDKYYASNKNKFITHCYKTNKLYEMLMLSVEDFKICLTHIARPLVLDNVIAYIVYNCDYETH